MKGLITDIQRMSIHDGPGIRTTVFFKGCNMRCAWCHNPETWSRQPQLLYVAAKCTACGTCAALCPAGALALRGGGIAIDRTRCTLCGTCAGECPGGALTLVGRAVTTAQVMKEIAQDKVFFDESGGGVTLSGGEPLQQSEFARELLAACRSEGIHTAVESNLTAKWAVIDPFLPLVDLWMCDLKLADGEAHKKWTGVDNGRIVENLHRLCAAGARVIVRTPVIPGVNDSEAEIGRICEVLRSMPELLRYELLEFHAFGFDKFTNLGMENPLSAEMRQDREHFKRLNEIPKKYGIKTKTN